MTEKKTKKLFIKTYGCQMNVYDSGRMADLLRPLGYETGDSPGDADMIILNTCHIREKATEKLFSDLGRLKPFKQKKEQQDGRMILAVAGCVAQAEGELIASRAPYVDMVFGPQTYHRLPQMVAEANRAAGLVLDTDFPAESKFDHLPEEQGTNGSSAFLAVQEGCDKFCTFCVVPYTRGSEFSRPAQQILDEARRLIDSGVKEITLLGQNVNAFHGDGPRGDTWNLAQLISALADMNGLERIRYTTSHPSDMDDDLINAHGQIEKLMPYLHLPLQSGSNKILEEMNRKHTVQSYFDIIERLRRVRPDIALSSDFIVGFPGESEKDFEDTLNAVRQVTYASAYSFKYSPRPGTPAGAYESQVPEPVKEERLARLQSLLTIQQTAFNSSKLGEVLPVLFDREGKRDGQLMGKTPFLQSLYVDNANPRLQGQIVPVRVTGAFQNGLKGEILLQEKDTMNAPVNISFPQEAAI
ncbi:MAG: tRNA (N6-isopentenyl adenosine(37)-C2)-methylthiotransferase MiaB [Alphaproteobacteria bacterium]|nr:MAG: tRNA (N6-isopentenyl adenosine(37)-C2)-methylthiotransferase MiaB [Alphaproteobacteria bacterium]